MKNVQQSAQTTAARFALCTLLIGAASGCDETSSEGGSDVADALEPDTIAADAATDVAEPDADAADAVEADTAAPDAADDAESDVDTVQRCNGHAALCDRPFDDVVLAGTHNSMASAEEGFLPPNQEHGMARQLEDGVRALMIDLQEWRGDFWLCHASCVLGATPAVEGLQVITDFLDANPNEVIAIIFQNDTGASPSAMATLLSESGLDAYAMSRSETTPWPTLAELIERDERALFTLESGSGDEATLPNAWSVYVDTPYTFETLEDMSCRANRGRSDHPLFLINHWLGAPLSTPELAHEANTYEALSARVSECEIEAGRLPNILAVDFYNDGALLQVVDELNGVN